MEIKNLMKRTIVIFVFGWIFGSLVFSQARIWTLEECIKHALTENISINQKKLSNEVDQITLEQTKANKMLIHIPIYIPRIILPVIIFQ